MQRGRDLLFGKWLLLALCLMGLSACAVYEPDRATVANGDPQRGVEALGQYGCGSCHTIPGIENAQGTVGPTLDNWAHRSYIAGNLTNTPDNLVYWIRFPQEVEPGTAMPNLGVSEQAARDMSAYLYTLPVFKQPWYKRFDFGE